MDKVATATDRPRPTVEDLVTGIDKNLADTRAIRDRLNSILIRLNEGRPVAEPEAHDKANPIVIGKKLLASNQDVNIEINDMISDLEGWIGFN